MGELKFDWLTEGLIDFEYKKYILLAYLREVRQNFSLNKLYPFLSDLVFHYRNLQRIRDNKQMIFEQFPKKISKADFERLKLTYRMIIEDDDIMKELTGIIEYAMTQFRYLLDEGKDIYEFVEENIEIIPIGLSPLYDDEGYLFIGERKKSEMEVYRYQITLFENSEEKYKGVHTRLVERFEKSVNSTYENIKVQLTRKFRDLPNPATYLMIANYEFPRAETLLPVAKRLLVKYISKT